MLLHRLFILLLLPPTINFNSEVQLSLAVLQGFVFCEDNKTSWRETNSCAVLLLCTKQTPKFITSGVAVVFIWAAWVQYNDQEADLHQSIGEELYWHESMVIGQRDGKAAQILMFNDRPFALNNYKSYMADTS